MTRTFGVFYGLVSLCLVVGCASEEYARGYLPSNDPLVLARFEESLNRERIAYTRDINGLYRAAVPAENNRLVRLGNKAQNVNYGKKTLQIYSGCAAQKMRTYLDTSETVYAAVLDEYGATLHLTDQDYRAMQIDSRWEQFKQECYDAGLPWTDAYIPESEQ